MNATLRKRVGLGLVMCALTVGALLYLAGVPMVSQTEEQKQIVTQDSFSETTKEEKLTLHWPLWVIGAAGMTGIVLLVIPESRKNAD